LKQELSYEDLYREYLELQLRVTRFSSIEQELINTRDKLDHELVVYKRLNTFVSNAIRFRSLQDLLQLVVESVIDIFEIQIGYIHFKRLSEEVNIEDIYFLEGHQKSEKDKLLNDFLNLESINIFSGKMKEFSSVEIDNYSDHSSLDICIISKTLNVGANCQLVIAAGIDKRNSPIYSKPDVRKQALFVIFIQQVESLVNNLLIFDKNREQMKLIRSSEIELRKLSMIATNTNNSVIITDNYGLIEWVNASFEEKTGYQLKEVIGLKPKNFLQVQDSRTEEARKLISAALAKKEAVEVEILNIDKQGNEYIIALQISPVYDKDGELINFIAIQKDITNEAKHRIEMQRINFRMDEITKGSSIGMWEYDIETRTAEWNDVLFEIYEVDKSATDLHKIWMEALHPEDVDAVLKDIGEMISGQKRRSVIEYRILSGRDKDTIKHIRTTAFREEQTDSKGGKVLGSTIDISETKNFESTLLEKNQELTKINRELDQFVYSVSHDLRSPLLSIKGILSVIDENVSHEENQMYLSLIEKSVNRLDSTIIEILDFSRNARLDQTYSRFNFRDMVQDIFSDLAYVTEDKVELKLKIEAEEIIESDKARLEILMKNLISNGIKYRKASSEISYVRVSLNETESSYVIVVEDNGEGISKDNQLKVFDMFYRASTSSSGTGLGLYICKDIVSKMDGNMELTSELGVGTQIRLTLPKNY
jgi:PAS domain S-box-containing protein